MLFPYCSKCKAKKNLCGLGYCPILKSIGDYIGNFQLGTGDVDTQTPPGVFIGEYNYPGVYAGPMAVADTSKPFFSRELFGKPMDELLKLNANRYRTSKTVRVTNIDSPFILELQDAAMSTNNVEMNFKNEKFIMRDSGKEAFDTPVGPMAIVSTLKIIENPKIPRKVDQMREDFHLKSQPALIKLYESGYEVAYLQGILSAGILGEKKRRKLVPTKWSITAVDETINAHLKEEITRYEQINELMLFTGEYLGNRFQVILLPGPYSFEMFEKWGSGSVWGEGDVSHDWEWISGRKDYADEITGAYYAARLSVSQYLARIRRQASIIVLRRIGGEYHSPMGVWVIRETVKNILSGPALKYNDRIELVKENKFIIENWVNLSKLWQLTMNQTYLWQF